MNPRSNLIALDLETSGVNPLRHEVLAVALVPFDDDVPEFQVYVRHQHVDWSDYARSIFRKYGNEWQANSVHAEVACQRIEQYLATHFLREKKVTLVGHNVGFDVAFLRRLAFLGGRDEIAGVSHRAIDTHTMLFVLCKQGRLPESALTSDGAFRHFGISIPEGARHTALGDAIATKRLVTELFGLLDISLESSRAHSGIDGL